MQPGGCDHIDRKVFWMLKTDVVVIGAGAVGCAVARELSKYEVDVIVVEKNEDVGGDASKSNSSIAITGFDCPPGSLEAALCHETRAQFDRVTRELDVPFRVCGALMPAITPEQMERLPAIYEEAMANGVTDVVYGHLHGQSIRAAKTGLIGTVRYHLKEFGSRP